MADVTRKINLQAGDASAVALIDKGTAALTRQQTGVQRLAAIYARDTRRFEADLNQRIAALRLEEKQVERVAVAYEDRSQAARNTTTPTSSGNLGGSLGAVERFSRGIGGTAGAEITGLIGDILDVKDALPGLKQGFTSLLTSIGPLGIGIGIVAAGFSALTTQLAAGKREVDAAVAALLRRREVERQIRDETLTTTEIEQRLAEARQRQADAAADLSTFGGVDNAAFAEAQRNVGDLGARIGTALVSLGGGFNTVNDAVATAQTNLTAATNEINALEAALRDGTAAANDAALAEEELLRSRRQLIDTEVNATNEARRALRDRGTDGLQELITAAKAEYEILSQTARELQRAAETDYPAYGDAAKAATQAIVLQSEKIVAYTDVLNSQDAVVSRLTTSVKTFTAGLADGLTSLTDTIGSVATSMTDLARKRTTEAQAALTTLMAQQRQNDDALLAEAQRRDQRLLDAQNNTADRIADLRQQIIDREAEYTRESLRRAKEHQRDLRYLTQDGEKDIKDLIRTGNFAEAIERENQLRTDQRRLNQRFKAEEKARADELKLFKESAQARIDAETAALNATLSAIQAEYDAKLRSYSDQKLALTDLMNAELQRIETTKQAMIKASESTLAAIAASAASKLTGIFGGLSLLGTITKSLLPLPLFGGLSSTSSASGAGSAGRGGVTVQVNTSGMFDGAAIGDMASMEQVESVVAYAQEQTGQALRMAFQQIARGGVA